jgi:hypothetical protein
MQKPDSFTKLGGGLFSVINSIVEIRKQNRANLVKGFDLMPHGDALVELELKFGGTLTPEDISGRHKREKKRRRNQNNSRSVLLS